MATFMENVTNVVVFFDALDRLTFVAGFSFPNTQTEDWLLFLDQIPVLPPVTSSEKRLEVSEPSFINNSSTNSILLLPFDQIIRHPFPTMLSRFKIFT